MLSAPIIDALLDTALCEDLNTSGHIKDAPIGDITSDSVIPANARLTAVMNAREAMTVCGLPIAEAAFKRMDKDARITLLASDGDKVAAGTALMTVDGSARALLAAERTALNFVQHLSGIATQTHTYTRLIEDLPARLLDTRKTTPGLRVAEKYAARTGGAQNHRMGLYDAVMIKDNHIAVVGSVTAAVEAAFKAGHTYIQVECDTLQQVQESVTAGATSLLLDNMPPAMLTEALKLVPRESITCEASGGVTLDTIRAIAETGVDFISVGRITQSAPAADIGLDYKPA